MCCNFCAASQTGFIRDSHPRSMGHHGDSKDFSPSNSRNNSKTAVLRQLPQPRQNWRVNCNLRCTIVTPDARVYHLALQTDCRESPFSLDFPRPVAKDADSDPEMTVFGKSFAVRTQAPAFDFRRRNGGIGAAGGVRGRVLRTQSVGAAAAEKITAAAEKSASAAEKVAGEEKRREQGRMIMVPIPTTPSQSYSSRRPER